MSIRDRSPWTADELEAEGGPGGVGVLLGTTRHHAGSS